MFYLPLKVDPWLAKRFIKRTFDKYGYFRDINPNQSNANASYVLAKDTYAAPEGSIIAFNMMQLVESGHLIPQKEVKVSIFRGQKVKMSLEISGKDREGLAPQLQRLLRIIDSAAGDDKILQEKELKKYSRRNDTVIRSYLNASEVAGINYFKKMSGLKKTYNMTRVKEKYLTEVGKEELGQIIGLKKYLEDFSLIEERGLSELPLWRDLLRYALLLGIADQLAQEIKRLYPEYTQEIENFNYTLATASAFNNSMYTGMRSAEAARSSGGGGSSSSGGGGGSSGGGSGGGSR